MMYKLSTGDDSTLENWLKLSKAVFGDDSPATKFIEQKIETQGPSEPVIADEAQMLHLLGQLHIGKEQQQDNGQ